MQELLRVRLGLLLMQAIQFGGLLREPFLQRSQQSAVVDAVDEKLLVQMDRRQLRWTVTEADPVIGNNS